MIATGPWTFTTANLPVEAGNYYVVSSFFKADSNLTLTLTGRDSDGNVTDIDPFDMGDSDVWARFSGTDIVGSTSTTVTYDLTFSGDAGTFYLDCVQFEKGGLPSYGPVTNPDSTTTYGVTGLTATEYFDGTLPSTFGAVWQGTANNSPTSVYFGKDLKMSRLADTISDWTPPNLFWRITSYAGVEATTPIV